jgi:hypothetical protein
MAAGRLACRHIQDEAFKLVKTTTAQITTMAMGNDKTLAGRLDAIRSRLIDRSRLATPRHKAGNGMVDSAR